MAVPGSAGVWVATDDKRIADEVTRFGGQVVMTSPDCANGTERCADAVERLGEVAPVIVNLQGDAPLSPSTLVPELVARLQKDEGAAMATPAVRCTRPVLDHLLNDAREGRVGGTTSVFNRDGRALYFSKRVIPYVPGTLMDEPCPVYLHLGLYAYRPEALARYRAAPVSTLERLEGLEQLRFLDMGSGVAVLAVERLSWDPIELNNPTDVPILERILCDHGIS